MGGGPLDRPAPAGQDGAYEAPQAAAHAVLVNAGCAPDWIATDLEIRRLLAEEPADARRLRHVPGPWVARPFGGGTPSSSPTSTRPCGGWRSRPRPPPSSARGSIPSRSWRPSTARRPGASGRVCRARRVLGRGRLRLLGPGRSQWLPRWTRPLCAAGFRGAVGHGRLRPCSSPSSVPRRPSPAASSFSRQRRPGPRRLRHVPGRAQ